jgi:O-antigen biosynthesis protein
MTELAVSVVVVSRGRPDGLARCLTGLAQLQYPFFEIVVVADPIGLAAIAPWGGRIKRVPFDVPNISAARNAGIGAAAGELVAFIDDDSVPEPTWLARLAAPFADPVVAAAGGLVRGRNGFDIQRKPAAVGTDGRETPLALDGPGPHLVAGAKGRGIKTEGTNMAFRRAVLAQVGGFDPGYRFYLDETDLNLRLGARGAITAIVPGAEVHHGFAESDRRRADRVPLTLAEVGASLALFLRRHHDGADPGILAAERAARRRGLLQHMVAGRIEPRDVGRILRTLDTGWAEGCARSLAPLGPLGAPEQPFVPFRPLMPAKGRKVIAGRTWQARRLRARAAAAAADGWIVSLFLFSPGVRPHRIAFDPAGFWQQTGGLLAPAQGQRTGHPTPRFRHRLAQELARLATTRTG